MKPLCIVLYAGLHGWEEAFVQEGYRCVGFDIVDMCALLGHPRPPNCHLVLQDVTTLHGLPSLQLSSDAVESGLGGQVPHGRRWSAAKIPYPLAQHIARCFREQA